VDEVKAMLVIQFPVTDLGGAHHFLSIQIIQLPRQTTLNQVTYIQTILHRFNMANACTVSTALNPRTRLEGTTSSSIQEVEFQDSEVEDTEYQSMIESLMYLIQCTRLDITFAVGALSRYKNSPNKHHMDAVKHLL